MQKIMPHPEELSCAIDHAKRSRPPATRLAMAGPLPFEDRTIVISELVLKP
jgi:hypothetical protein